jgi:hypothetical protein
VCSPLWTAPVSADTTIVTVSGGIAYALTGSNSAQTVVALSSSGTTGCSGTPTVCTPLWEYALSYPVQNGSGQYVTVSGSTLYVGTAEVVSVTDVEGNVEAFDATGSSGCSGTPKVCSPLWAGESPSSGPPLVGDGVAFSTPFSQSLPVAAFDADGSNCCNPLWESSIDVTPLAIAGSVLYATNPQNVFAFDATGNAGCSNSVCTPLWSTGRPNGSSALGTAIVANGTLYVTTQDSSGDGEVLAYGLS